MVLILTVVRHGESTDNLKSVWAGSKDAPLSNHGMQQAEALGKSFAKVPITAIYSSPLLRARWTGEAIQRHNLSEPKPQITFSALLQEQHFGDAEGKPWGGPGAFERLTGRDAHYSNGESLNMVGKRASDVFTNFILPHLKYSHEHPEEHVHVVTTAHGIFNSELLGFLARSNSPEPLRFTYTAMTNTGHSRVLLDFVGHQLPAHSDIPEPEKISRPASPTENITQSSIPSAASQAPAVYGKYQLKVNIESHNNTPHLEGLKRQGGGIGSSAHDPKQQDMRKFFGGESSL